MILIRRFPVFFFLFFTYFSFAQKSKNNDKVIITNIENHIRFLADDKLEGRRAGTIGEDLAMSYITNKFKEIGLQPKGSDGFYQPFDINEGKQFTEKTLLLINNESLEVNKDYFPLIYSPNVTLEALPAIAIQEPDMPWFVDVKEIIEDNATNPHFDLNDYIHKQASLLKKKGATALFYYHSGFKDDWIKTDSKDKSEMTPIPVIYLSSRATKKYFKDLSSTLSLKMAVDIAEKKRKGHNVIGYIDNGVAKTVVIGAHFDHLGYGEDGNSMLRTGEKLIHNGADDNASGTAALIEVARLLKTSKLKNSNYLFIAFSGEELGLFGSKYFVENPTVDLKNVNYMINMDMVGRLNDSSRTVTVGGYGTTPAWALAIRPTDKKNPFNIRIDSSGTGPSDHTSFYRKEIPVLFFFTGLHTDYHKPTDDFEKINYPGELKIIKYIVSVITELNKQNPKFTFTKTRETQTSSSARFNVSLGIMPDYTFSGNGVRVDGVSDGKPAQKAGLQTGDIILQLGDFPVSSLEMYMQALGKFKKGDTATVKFKRGNEEMKKQVEF